MTDAAYVYSQEVRERKRNSYGARNRKCGSKSKSCKLPNDHLSASQKRKLNGGVTVYQLKKPMSYEEFKKMPGDLQIQYLKFCVEMGGRKKDIAEMFGISTNTFDSYMYQKHKGEMTFKKGKNTASMQWLDWVTAPDGGGERGRNKARRSGDSFGCPKAGMQEAHVRRRRSRVSEARIPGVSREPYAEADSPDEWHVHIHWEAGGRVHHGSEYARP